MQLLEIICEVSGRHLLAETLKLRGVGRSGRVSIPALRSSFPVPPGQPPSTQLSSRADLGQLLQPFRETHGESISWLKRRGGHFWIPYPQRAFGFDCSTCEGGPSFLRPSHATALLGGSKEVPQGHIL